MSIITSLSIRKEITPVVILRWANYWNNRRPIPVRQRSTGTGESPTAEFSTNRIIYQMMLCRCLRVMLFVRRARTWYHVRVATYLRCDNCGVTCCGGFATSTVVEYGALFRRRQRSPTTPWARRSNCERNARQKKVNEIVHTYVQHAFLYSAVIACTACQPCRLVERFEDDR